MFSDMAASAPPSGIEEIQRRELTRLFGRVVWARLLVFPVLFALLLWLVFSDPAPWRRSLAVVVVVTLFLFFVGEAYRFRRQGVGRLAVELNVGAAVLGQMLMVAATGGLESPFLYPMILVTLVVALNVSLPVLRVMVGFQVAGVWTVAGIELLRLIPDFNPTLFGGGPRAGHTDAHLWIAAAVASVATVASAVIGHKARWIFNTIVQSVMAAQQDALRTHAERAEELTALSAEIAHELKNPLASVKGLAGLLAQSVPDQKGAERLSVLRHEVDRMQSILEEFLNFSRPLVPLALGKVDLPALCREVAALHEGMAQERGLELRVNGQGVTARCDPRKVKQVLINLVQNALEASPRGAAVELEVAASEAGEAAVQVLDRGPGPAAELGEKVFEPGITTKARGSGLGLTIARALARQHGGDLTVGPRPGGGCLAELRLPAGAAPAHGEAA